jgi:putative SOS response-associated peptidase YedK
MCGRFVNSRPPDEMRRLFRTVNPERNFQPSWNIAPSQEAPAIRVNPETGQHSLDLLSWGLVPHWTDDLKSIKRPINARAESLATSPMFRDAFARRRALIPADAFYEWRADGAGRKQPYAIARRDRDVMAFAGVWEGWRSKMGTIIRSFAIITTSANAIMAPIHDRMPVIIGQADWPLWLGEVDGDAEQLLRPAPDDLLEVWPVGLMVNSPRNNGPELLEPVPIPS